MITIISRQSSASRQAIRESMAKKYGETRLKLRAKYRPDEQRNLPDTLEESRAKLVKRDFFKRD